MLVKGSLQACRGDSACECCTAQQERLLLHRAHTCRKPTECFQLYALCDALMTDCVIPTVCTAVHLDSSSNYVGFSRLGTSAGHHSQPTASLLQDNLSQATGTTGSSDSGEADMAAEIYQEMAAAGGVPQPQPQRGSRSRQPQQAAAAPTHACQRACPSLQHGSRQACW